MKRSFLILLAVLMCASTTLFVGCGCEHDWEDATCEQPKTCKLCDKTEGDVAAHVWNDATCENPKTCETCSTTEGEPLAHVWNDATCENAKECEVCNSTEGEPLAHDLTEANYQQSAICNVCGYIDGEPLTPGWANSTLEYQIAEVGKDYPIEVACYSKPELTTVATINIAEHKVFDGDETYEKEEGYEWHKLIVYLIFNDDNALQYGFDATYTTYCMDYYQPSNENEDDEPFDENGFVTYTVNFNGIEYDKCLQKAVKKERSNWVFSPTTGQSMFIISDTIIWRQPVGYDGYMIAYDSGSVETTDGYYWEYASDKAVPLRIV